MSFSTAEMTSRAARRRLSPGRVLAILAIAALGPFPAGAEEDRPPALKQYVHKAWRAEAGLKQASVTAIAQTPDGYLWLGTEEGLVRFDGHQAVTFDSRNTPALRSNLVVSLLLDRGGTLWIGTHGGGLLSFRDGRFNAGGPLLPSGSETVPALYEDQQGDLWIGTDGAGLFRRRLGKVERFTQKDGLVDDSVFSLSGDAKGTLWIGTRRGISRMSNGRFTALPAHLRIGASQVHAVHQDRNGTLWIAATGRGLYRYDDAGLRLFTARDGLPSTSLSSLYEDHRGALWIGTFDSGVSLLANGRFDSLTAKDGLPGSGVWATFEDRDGTVWLGGTEGGLNSLRPGVFALIGAKEGLAGEMTLGTLEARDGSMWLGSDKGLTRLAGGRTAKYTAKDGLPDNLVLSLAQDGQGTIWAGTRTGLARFNGQAFERVGAREGFAASGAVLCAFADRHGRLWAGSHGTLSHFDGERFHTFGTADGLPNTPVMALYEDDHDTLWIGTDGGGLVRYSQGRFTTLTTRDGLPVNLVWSILGDAGDTLWLGTNGGGLVRYAGGRFYRYTRDQGLSDDVVFQILDDRCGRLWLTSNKGISSVRKEALLALGQGEAAGAAGGGAVARVYGPGAGLRTSECNGGFQPAGCRSRDGRLWFPTMGGAAVLDPSRLTSREKPRPVIVEEVLAGNQVVHDGEGQAIPPGRRALEFHFTSPSFREPEKLAFRYKLDGFDTGWNEAGTRRTAYYTNLPPGDYRFEAAACLEGVCTPAAAATAIRLLPAFQETAAFRALLGLAALGLIALGHKFRVRHLRAKERELNALIDERTSELLRSRDELRQSRDQLELRVEERTQDLSLTNQRLEGEIAVRREAEIRAEAASRAKSEFLANMSHELRTPMNGVIGMLELAAGRASEPQQKEQLELASQSADHLLAVLNDILDFSRLDEKRLALERTEFDLHKLLEKAARMIAPAAETQGLTLLVDIEPPVPRMMEGDATRLLQALLNLLTNAVKFTAGGEVILSARRVSGGDLRMTVADTGPGIPEEKREAIFDPFVQADTSITRKFGGTGLGLAISRRLVGLMGGTLTVESRVGAGSRFSITLPAGAAAGEPEPPPAALAGRSLLLHEPNAAAREMIARWLHGWGMAWVFLPDLRPESIALARQPFDFLLLDTSRASREDLPAVERAMREHQPGALPVAMSGPSMKDQAAGVRMEGPKWARLMKPLLAAELRETLLRLVEGAAPRVKNGAPRAAVKGLELAGRLRVLVAEDNYVNQRVVKAILERSGCAVVVVGNGAEAVEACRRECFDLVLMDLQMPVMDGFEATETIRKREAEGRRSTVVALTAHAMSADRQRCLDAGMDDYLSKPIDLAKLGSILSQLSARQSAEPLRTEDAGADAPAHCEA